MTRARRIALAAAAAALGACGRDPSAAAPAAAAVRTAASAPLAGGEAPPAAASGRARPGGAPGAAEMPPPGRAPTFVETSPSAGLLDAVRDERRAAEAAGEALVVYVGARWCEPCQRFERALASGRLDGSLAGLRLLHVDLDARGPELGSHGYATGVIPYFVVPTAKGTASARRFAAGAAGAGVVDQIVAGLAPWRPPPH